MQKSKIKKTDPEITRRALNLHRAIKGAGKEAEKEILSLIKLLDIEFSNVGTKRFATLSKGVLELLENKLVTLENLIAQRAVDIANANSPVSVTASTIKGLSKTHVGPNGTLREMVKTSHKSFVKRFSNEMSRLNAEGLGTREIRNAIIGSRKNKFNDGLMGEYIRGSNVMMRTATTMANEAANDTARRSEREIIGYVWVSVLDEGTTLTCADLNGREFYYADNGHKPLPPQHVGCRSTTEPIYRGEPIPEVQNINTFLKENPDQAREMLGATRYNLWKDGNLRIDRFNDRNFTPLTLDKLQQKNAVAFKRIK